jgi:uncharacterized protein YjiS (DUF1127 family)
LAQGSLVEREADTLAAVERAMVQLFHSVLDLFCSPARWQDRPIERSHCFGFKRRISMFVAFLLSRIHAYRRYRTSARELSHFSDRELDDLGISRYEIETAA